MFNMTKYANLLVFFSKPTSISKVKGEILKKRPLFYLVCYLKEKVLSYDRQSNIKKERRTGNEIKHSQ